MSFDLFFCRKGKSAPTDAELASFCREVPGFQTSDNKSWVYENEATGVYFMLDRESANPEDDDDDENSSVFPPGMTDARLVVNINYFRPSFFGDEAMQIVARLCEALDLYIIDPQSGNAKEQSHAERPTSAELAERWQLSNAQATQTLLKTNNTDVMHWSRTRSRQWHSYQLARSDIDAQLEKKGCDIFTPNLKLVCEKDSPTQLKTLVIWTDSIPFVFPPCDLVGILRKRKRLFGAPVDERGIVRAEIVRSDLSHLLKPLQTSIGTLDHLPEAAAPKARSIVAKYDLTTPFESIEGVAADSFIDDLP